MTEEVRMSMICLRHRLPLPGGLLAMVLALCSAPPVHSETQAPSAPDQPIGRNRHADQPDVYVRLGVGVDEPDPSRYRDETPAAASTRRPCSAASMVTMDGRSVPGAALIPRSWWIPLSAIASFPG